MPIALFFTSELKTRIIETVEVRKRKKIEIKTGYTIFKKNNHA